MPNRNKRTIKKSKLGVTDVIIRILGSCFVLLMIYLLMLPWLISLHNNPLRDRLPAVGPRVPIPEVDPATVAAGRAVYQREECSHCHALRDAAAAVGPDPSVSPGTFGTTVPDLTHEGQRNASIDWQISNLAQHHRLFPNSIMPDYGHLPPGDLRALASYLATRR